MRFPVFARRSDPAVDAPILRKSFRYVSDQVDAGRADWIDPLDPKKGIRTREVLYFAPRPPAPEPAILVELAHGFAPRELPGLKYIPPASDPRPSLGTIAAGWDYRYEIVPQLA